MGVERGVATRRAQIVWPMMTVTVKNFEGFTRLAKMWKFGSLSSEIHIFANFLPSEALKICRSNCHHGPHHLSTSCGHTPFHTTLFDFLMIFF